jgi:hypothetical protein
MLLIDYQVYHEIFKLTAKILRDNFFYSNEVLSRFIEMFNKTIEAEYEILEQTAADDFRKEMKSDQLMRFQFTSYFVSVHLQNVLVDEFHFSDMELDAFDNILPKLIGANSDVKQSNERKSN